MKKKLSTEVIRELTRTPPATVTDVYDSQQPGLVMRIRPSGAYTYRALLGRGRWHTLGGSELKVAAARELARAVRGDVSKARALGEDDPIRARQAERTALTLTRFLDLHFEPWVLENRRSGVSMVASVRSILLPAFGSMKLDAITPFTVERWRTQRLKADISPSTINRNTDNLKSMLSRAVTWKLLKANPIASLRRLRIDTAATIRFLTAAEESRLLKALEARDKARRAERETSNAWRRERGYAEWLPFGTYTDPMTPLVTLALHTGLRRGELFDLRWADVNLSTAVLTVQGATAKSAQTRHVPLNETAVKVLTDWKPAEPEDLVFPSPASGDRYVTLKTSWAGLLKAAKITAFRFHDTRHTFASKLVMAGIDLNTVRELLGHSDLKMTLRYAHLAPEVKAAAVAKLVSR